MLPNFASANAGNLDEALELGQFSKAILPSLGPSLFFRTFV